MKKKIILLFFFAIFFNQIIIGQDREIETKFNIKEIFTMDLTDFNKIKTEFEHNLITIDGNIVVFVTKGINFDTLTKSQYKIEKHKIKEANNENIKEILTSVHGYPHVLTNFYSEYGTSRTHYVSVDPGNSNFEVDGIAAKKNTEWYVNGVHQIGEDDWSGDPIWPFNPTDPDYTYYFTSGTIEIRAEIYNNYWQWEEMHKWVVTVKQPDLIVQDIKISPDPAIIGSSYKITATLKNQGDVSASPFSIKYYVDNSEVGSDVLSFGLGAGNSNDETLTLTTPPYTSGTHQVKVVVDSGNEIDEGSNENNNSRTENFIWIPTPQPDLIVTDILMNNSTNLPSVVPGENVRLDFIGKNIGDATSKTSIGMKWWWGTSENAKTHEIATGLLGIINGLSPEEEETETDASWTIPAVSPGTYWLTAEIDYDNKQDDEKNENNNIRSESFTIATPPQPDLIVTDILMNNSTNLMSVVPGENVRLDFIGKNIGDAKSKTSIGMKWWWGTSENSKTYEIATGLLGIINGLSPEEEETETDASWTIPNVSPGTYWLTSEIDYDNKQDDEKNENNNIRSESFEILSNGTIKIVGVTQLAHSDQEKTGIKVVAEINPKQGNNISGAYLIFSTDESEMNSILSFIFNPIGSIFTSLLQFNESKMSQIPGTNYYEYVIDKKTQMPSYLGGGLFKFNSKDIVRWKIIAVDNESISYKFPIDISSEEETPIFNYYDLNSNIEISNSVHGFVKPYLTSLTQLAVENNKFFYLGVMLENENEFVFTTEGLYSSEFLGMNVLQSKTIPLGVIWPPKMIINDLEQLAVGDKLTVSFSKNNFWAILMTSCDFLLNILDLKYDGPGNAKFILATIKTLNNYYEKLISSGQVIDTTDAVKFAETLIPFILNDGPKFIEAWSQTLLEEEAGDAVSMVTKSIAKMTPLKIYSQSKSLVNATFTAVDYFSSATNDAIEIKKGNGHFIEIEPIELAGSNANNALEINTQQTLKLKVKNTSNQKLYNIWLGFDIFTFDRDVRDYIKVENTKTPIPDPIDYEGTGKIGKIEFLNQGIDLNPNESYIFETLPYNFTTSVTGFQYHSDYIPYKYIYSAWSSGYPGQKNPLATRLTNINVSVPFYIKDNIPPKAPIIFFDNTVSSDSVVFIKWEINNVDLNDASKLELFINDIKNRDIDANEYTMVLVDKKGEEQRLKMRLIDNGNNISEFSNILNVDTITSVNESLNKIIPKVFSMSQNYPNPFNPTTEIIYTVPEQSFISLTIYNTIGEEIAILANEVQPAGKYEKEFNAKSISSGVYFYVLSAQSLVSDKTFRKTGKMLLLK